MSGPGKSPGKPPVEDAAQEPGAQGQGNAHGVPAEHEGATEGKPFDPAGGHPAQDVDAAAEKLVRQAPAISNTKAAGHKPGH